MAWKKEHRTLWGETHSMGGLNFNTDSGGPQEIRFGSSTTPKPVDSIQPQHRLVAETCGHSLLYNRTTKEYTDRVPVHGYTYIGRFKCDREAIAVWRGWLRSQGVGV